MSTLPAFPSSESDACDSERTVLDMRQTFGLIRTNGYGALRVMRNLCCVIGLFSGTAHAETVKIAALGDSLTAGYGLPLADGFVPQLQAWLDAQGADVEILNAGVSGDTTAGGLSRTDWTLTPDVDGMIVALGGNDYLRGLDPALSRENLRAILTKAQDAGVEALLVGLLAGGNYGPAYQVQFNANYVDLAAAFDVPLYPDIFAGLLAEAQSQDQVVDYLQADGIHPNAKGVAANVAAIGPAVLALISSIE